MFSYCLKQISNGIGTDVRPVTDYNKNCVHTTGTFGKKLGNKFCRLTIQNCARSALMGADINAKSDNGSTPLSIAVGRGFKSFVQFLIDNGAKDNSLSSD